ncbi:MAG TPA: RNA polymerase sigma-70 factor [Chitinophaga sp.]
MEIHEQGVPTGRSRGEMEFEALFRRHFKNLYAYACSMLHDEVMAEEMVQNVFCKLWEKGADLRIQQSITAYLYRAVYHECLNYIRHLKVRAAHQSFSKHHQSPVVDSSASRVQLHELQVKLEAALQQLPEKCRVVFQLSRFEDLRYQEIADRLQISVKTVENQMGKALRILRTELVDFLPLLLLLFLNF